MNLDSGVVNTRSRVFFMQTVVCPPVGVQYRQKEQGADIVIWLLVILAMLIVFAETVCGKVVFGAAAIGVGLLLISWITGWSLFVPVAKVCAVVIVVTVVLAILAVLHD